MPVPLSFMKPSVQTGPESKNDLWQIHQERARGERNRLSKNLGR